MKHTAILLSALAAGLGRPVRIAPDGIEHKLYAYARERKFPPPETLARKAAELAGGDYPYKSIAEAPEGERVFFTAFRTVTEALEPFHEDDDPNEQTATEAQAATDHERLYDASAPMADGDVRMTAAEDVLGWLLIEKIGVVDDQNYTPKEAQETIAKAIDDLHGYQVRADELKAVHDTAVSPGNADANEYMRGMANGLILAVATMNGGEPVFINPPTKQEEKMNEDDKKPDDQVDEVEQKRRAGQAEMDKAIAESGGKFSDADKAKKKTK